MRYFSTLAIISYIIFFINGNYIFLYAGIILGLILLYYYRYNLNLEVKYFILFLFLGYLLIFYNNGFDYGKTYLPIMLSSLGIAISIFHNLTLHKYIANILVYLLFGYFYIYLFINLSLKDSLQFSSNHISTILLFFLIYYYYITTEVFHKKFNIIPIYLLLLLTIFAANMSGILSSIIILVGYFYLYNPSRIKVLSYIILFCLLFPFMLINILYTDINGYSELLDKFYIYRLFENNERLNIWVEYYNLLDIKKFIFGVPIKETLSIGNLHNSFLLLHAKIGILALYPIYLFLKVMYYNYKLNNMMFYILLALLFRSCFDTITFHGGFFEWIIFVVIFSSSYSNLINKYSNNYVS